MPRSTRSQEPSSACPLAALSRSFQLGNEELEAIYACARASGSVAYLEDIDFWAVTKHRDVKSILGDTARFSAEITLDPVAPFAPEVIEHFEQTGFSPRPTLSNNTSPRHPAIRKNAQIAFSPRRLAKIEPRIRKLVDDAIDGFIDDGRADLVAQMVYELPALVLFILMGIPDEDVGNVKRWADNRLLMTFGRLSPAEQLEAARELSSYWQYCLELVQKKRREPGDDLPTDMLALLDEDDVDITIEDINNVVFGLLLAGHETTTNASANAIHVLLQNRDAWESLVDDPALIPAAVEETLRFRPSVIAWRRKTREPVQIDGVEVPEGARLLLFIASANRDEAVFEMPERFDIEREDARAHIAFGFGQHFCLGAPLARLELGIILERLTERLPALRLAPDNRFEAIETIQFRGPKELLVEWD